jgi:hypothetical protein
VAQGLQPAGQAFFLAAKAVCEILCLQKCSPLSATGAKARLPWQH